MKSLAILLSATLLSACTFTAPPPGWAPPPAAADAAPLPQEPAFPQEPATDAGWPDDAASEADAGAAPVGGVAKQAPAPVEELDTAGLCTKASTCTTRVSMEVCGMFDPKCLDGFHKHADGATRDKCQAKLDRLPKLVEKYGRPGYALPPGCR